ncbi:hypothetical protein NG99_26195 [Erwinia typographi]|uniref:Phage gp6-like head-tail connector protein n=1 Tax=Erwinia typographi TaxID=371042 RepID=A0A0A3YLN1_9GAMM|nr:head-tail connector protein [Erwinia typographi]KGT86256.1 hypothetical protein NG99_26195 [Erwinia typographi]
MTDFVTLKEVKDHLRRYIDEENDWLEDTISDASATVLDYVKGHRDEFIDEKGELIEGAALRRVRRGTLALIAVLDRIRAGEDKTAFPDGDLPFSVKAILRTLHVPTII